MINIVDSDISQTGAVIKLTSVYYQFLWSTQRSIHKIRLIDHQSCWSFAFKRHDNLFDGVMTEWHHYQSSNHHLLFTVIRSKQTMLNSQFCFRKRQFQKWLDIKSDCQRKFLMKMHLILLISIFCSSASSLKGKGPSF